MMRGQRPISFSARVGTTSNCSSNANRYEPLCGKRARSRWSAATRQYLYGAQRPIQSEVGSRARCTRASAGAVNASQAADCALISLKESASPLEEPPRSLMYIRESKAIALPSNAESDRRSANDDQSNRILTDGEQRLRLALKRPTSASGFGTRPTSTMSVNGRRGAGRFSDSRRTSRSLMKFF